MDRPCSPQDRCSRCPTTSARRRRRATAATVAASTSTRKRAAARAACSRGQTDDAFFLDLSVFDLLYGANLSEAGVDSLAGFNVHSLALRVPKAALRSGSPIIGVWATASRPTTTTRAPGTETGSGAFVQVSRLGMPLVNEVVI